MTSAGVGELAVEVSGIKKRYGSIEALRGASLRLYRGQVTALIGDNGAGKSTLVKAISGEVRPDEGRIAFNGELVALAGTGDSRRLGVETIYQDLALAPDLTVAENMFLGREVRVAGLAGRLGVLDKRTMQETARQILAELGIKLKSFNAPVRSLSGGQRQAIAVARAMKWARHAVLMDEPTAALGTLQRELVYNSIRKAVERNLAVLLISHDIPQMLRFADKIVVLRHGENVAEMNPKQVDLRQVVDAMLGEANPK